MDFLATPLKDYYKWENLLKHSSLLVDEVKLKSNDIELVDLKRFVGIEVEVENIQRKVLCDSGIWYGKEDGSLRNNGIEFITYPIRGKDIRYAVQNLFEALPKETDFSDRTSIHIHVNVRDLKLEAILNVVILYIVFERLLYKFAGSHRYKNIFCVPIQETKLPIALGNFIATGHIAGLIKEWQKYSGMNLVPIRQFGTIEFRHMEGNRDIMRVINWINILLAIFKFAKEIEFKDLFHTIQRLNSTSYYDDFLSRVFQKQADLLRTRNLQGDMEQGVSTIKAVTLPSPFLLELIRSIDNESSLLKSMGISKTQSIGAHVKNLVYDDIIKQIEPMQWHQGVFAHVVGEIV